MIKGISLQSLWIFILGAILSLGSYATPLAVPQLQARVMDLTNTLSAAQQSELENKLGALEQAKGSQLAVLIVPTTGEETIEQYSIRVADAWRLGRKGVDDGALLLIAKDDRTVRIEVGKGLEGALPDVIASRIIRQVIVPAFKAGDMVGGINAGVDKISAVIQGEALPEASPTATSGAGSTSELPFILLVPLLVLGGVLRKAFGFFISFALSAGIATLGLVYFGLALPLAIGIGLFIGLFVGSNTGSGGAFLGGGGGFGRGGGGGGFSGGGGGFGGGGASGKW